jgi:ATP-binding cassette subfamily C (CFTR/MRP) protein 1
MLTIFSPAVTLITYAIQAELRGIKSIDVNVAFTSLAIIGMVTSPANRVLAMVAHLASAIASYDRIQRYLTSLDREDKREILNKYTNGSNGHGHEDDSNPFFNSSRISTLLIDGCDTEELAISINNATIRPAPVADPVLFNIVTTMKKGSLIICCGAVGTGKTTLVKALLGDLLPDTGSIKTAFGSIAYCSQTSWLINGTIRDIIQGPWMHDKEVDEAWYQRVLKACDLHEDLNQLPDRDQTLIGSRGIILSGGQKHRVVSNPPLK